MRAGRPGRGHTPAARRSRARRPGVAETAPRPTGRRAAPRLHRRRSRRSDRRSRVEGDRPGWAVEVEDRHNRAGIQIGPRGIPTPARPGSPRRPPPRPPVRTAWVRGEAARPVRPGGMEGSQRRAGQSRWVPVSGPNWTRSGDTNRCHMPMVCRGALRFARRLESRRRRYRPSVRRPGSSRELVAPRAGVVECQGTHRRVVGGDVCEGADRFIHRESGPDAHHRVRSGFDRL